MQIPGRSPPRRGWFSSSVFEARKSSKLRNAVDANRRYFLNIDPHIAALLLLVVFATQAFFGMLDKSFTVDEPRYLSRGLPTDRKIFHIINDHPPLVGLLYTAVVGAVCAGEENCAWFCEFPFFRRKYKFWCEDRPADYKERFFRNVRLAMYGSRSVNILLAVFLGASIYSWASELYGRRLALFPLLLFAFNIDLLAHAGLATFDLGIALFYFTSLYAYWRWTKKPTVSRAAVVGISVGAALSVKHVALMLFPTFLLVGILGAIYRKYRDRGDYSFRAELLRFLGHGSIVVMIAVLCVNASYLFADTGQPLSAYEWYHVLPSWLFTTPGIRTLPIPLPHEYVDSIFRVHAHLAHGDPGYVLGKVQPIGVWYYFPVAFLLKSSLSFLLMIGIALIARIGLGVFSADDLHVIVPAALFGGVMMCSTMNIGVRYLLPLVPLLIMFCTPLVTIDPLKYLWLRRITAAIAIGYVGSALMAYPNYLSFFNTLAGGTCGGRRYLSDSNLDWGQDLPALRSYMEDHGIRRISILPQDEFLRGPGLEINGIPYSLIDEGALTDGYVVISDSLLLVFRSSLSPKLQEWLGDPIDYANCVIPIFYGRTSRIRTSSAPH